MNTPTIIAFHFPHKAASMFAFKVLRTLSEHTGFRLFSQNNSPANHYELSEAANTIRNGILLRGPVRNFTVTQGVPNNPDVAYRFCTPEHLLDSTSYKAVCQTRDVLDLVTSQYFSHGWIHPPVGGFGKVRKDLQAGRLSVYEYAIMEFEGRIEFGQDSILSKMKDLSRLKGILGENVLCLRYEEMMLDYDHWADRIQCFLAQDLSQIDAVLSICKPGYTQPPETFEFFADPIDYVRKYGHTFDHIRSPFPGDHRRFLTQYEIDDLRRREKALAPDFALPL